MIYFEVRGTGGGSSSNRLGIIADIAKQRVVTNLGGAVGSDFGRADTESVNHQTGNAIRGTGRQGRTVIHVIGKPGNRGFLTFDGNHTLVPILAIRSERAEVKSPGFDALIRVDGGKLRHQPGIIIRETGGRKVNRGRKILRFDKRLLQEDTQRSLGFIHLELGLGQQTFFGKAFDGHVVRMTLHSPNAT